MPVSPGASGMQPRDPGCPWRGTLVLDTSLDEGYWPCSQSRVIPSFPSQLEWKMGLPWANTRGILNAPSYLERNRTLGPPLENSPEIPPSSRDEGLRLLRGLEANLAAPLRTQGAAHRL